MKFISGVFTLIAFSQFANASALRFQVYLNVNCAAKTIAPAPDNIFYVINDKNYIVTGFNSGPNENKFSISVLPTGIVQLNVKDSTGQAKSIGLGNADLTDVCGDSQFAPKGTVEQPVKLISPANLSIAISRAYSSPFCIPHPLWPNEPGWEFYRSYDVTTTISDSLSKTSIELKNSDTASFRDQVQCHLSTTPPTAMP